MLVVLTWVTMSDRGIATDDHGIPMDDHAWHRHGDHVIPMVARANAMHTHGLPRTTTAFPWVPMGDHGISVVVTTALPRMTMRCHGRPGHCHGHQWHCHGSSTAFPWVTMGDRGIATDDNGIPMGDHGIAMVDRGIAADDHGCPWHSRG